MIWLGWLAPLEREEKCLFACLGDLGEGWKTKKSMAEHIGWTQKRLALDLPDTSDVGMFHHWFNGDAFYK